MLTPRVSDLLTPGHPQHRPFGPERNAHGRPTRQAPVDHLGRPALPTRAEQRAAYDAQRCEVCGDAAVYCGCEPS